MSYYCENCREICETPKEVLEPDGLDSPPYRATIGCPLCNSDDIFEIAELCSACNAPIAVDEDYYYCRTGENYCSNCIEEKRGN